MGMISLVPDDKNEKGAPGLVCQPAGGFCLVVILLMEIFQNQHQTEKNWQQAEWYNGTVCVLAATPHTRSLAPSPSEGLHRVPALDSARLREIYSR